MQSSPTANHTGQMRDTLCQTSSCAAPKLTRVPAHVNELPSHTGCIQGPFNNSLGGPHEGVDGAVGGGTSVHIQQHAARCPGDGMSQCIDHLAGSGGGQ